MPDDLSVSPSSRSGVAGRYAKALFELACEEGTPDAVGTELERLDALVRESDDLRAFLDSPVPTRRDRVRAVPFLKEHLRAGPLTTGLLGLLAEKGRLSCLADIIRAFRFMVAARRNETVVRVTSAVRPEEHQADALRRKLETVTGRTVTLDIRIDPELLGGFVVRTGSQMIDASLKTKLGRLNTAMKEV